MVLSARTDSLVDCCVNIIKHECHVNSIMQFGVQFILPIPERAHQAKFGDSHHGGTMRDEGRMQSDLWAHPVESLRGTSRGRGQNMVPHFGRGL